jgi:hypothetical protein
VKDMSLRASNDQLRQDNARLRRQNARLRDVVLHDCPVCRVARCDVRERLMHAALGREWLLLRVLERE